MKQVTRTILACALFSLFFSCGSTYVTPFKNDEVFTQKELDRNLLGEHGEEFEKRGDYLSKASGLQPEDGETYKVFENRFINTLVVQEYDLGSYKDLISAQKNNIQSLQSQLDQLEDQNLDLRVQYQAMLGKEEKKEYERTAFQPYRIQKGDTLQSVAKKFFGTHTAWFALYQFNQFYIQNPNRIEEGDLVWIPSFTGL